MDFYDGVIPTPGSRNTIIIYSHLDIDFYPAYIPKIQNNSDYSIPFAIKTNMTNFSCLQNFQALFLQHNFGTEATGNGPIFISISQQMKMETGLIGYISDSKETIKNIKITQ